MWNDFHLLLEVSVVMVAAKLATARVGVRQGLATDGGAYVLRIHERFTHRVENLSEFMKTLLQWFTRLQSHRHQWRGTLGEETSKVCDRPNLEKRFTSEAAMRCSLAPGVQTGYLFWRAMKNVPISAYLETLGLSYFPRMLDKIRLHAAGTLRDDFTANLGSGFDARCLNFLRVSYDALCQRTLQGGSDEDILLWCYQTGRELNAEDCFVWNEFMRKVGWNDAVSEILTRRKGESGLQDVAEIETMFEYFEFDEGRKSH